MGTCNECKNIIGTCDNCGDNLYPKENILCYLGEQHFCNDDCLLTWLKLNIVKETIYEETI